MKSIIVAYDKNFGIGANNDLLWGRDLPADLRHFKDITTGHAIIMGLNTFKSIGRALPNRQNIVVCYPGEMDSIDDITVVNSLEDAYGAIEPGREAFVIGGGQIYKMAFDSVDKIYATEVDAIFDNATIFFPKVDTSVWRESSREKHQADDSNMCGYDFVEYVRI